MLKISMGFVFLTAKVKVSVGRTNAVDNNDAKKGIYPCVILTSQMAPDFSAVEGAGGYSGI